MKSMQMKSKAKRTTRKKRKIRTRRKIQMRLENRRKRQKTRITTSKTSVGWPSRRSEASSPMPRTIRAS